MSKLNWSRSNKETLVRRHGIEVNSDLTPQHIQPKSKSKRKNAILDDWEVLKARHLEVLRLRAAKSRRKSKAQLLRDRERRKQRAEKGKMAKDAVERVRKAASEEKREKEQRRKSQIRKQQMEAAKRRLVERRQAEERIEIERQKKISDPNYIFESDRKQIRKMKSVTVMKVVGKRRVVIREGRARGNNA